MLWQVGRINGSSLARCLLCPLIMDNNPRLPDSLLQEAPKDIQIFLPSQFLINGGRDFGWVKPLTDWNNQKAHLSFTHCSFPSLLSLVPPFAGQELTNQLLPQTTCSPPVSPLVSYIHFCEQRFWAVPKGKLVKVWGYEDALWTTLASSVQH